MLKMAVKIYCACVLNRCCLNCERRCSARTQTASSLTRCSACPEGSSWLCTSVLAAVTFRIINFWTRENIHCNWCSIDVWHVFLNICAADMGQLSYGQLQLPCFSYSYVWLYVKTINYNCDHAVINYNSVKVVIDPCLLCWCCELILTWS